MFKLNLLLCSLWILFNFRLEASTLPETSSGSSCSSDSSYEFDLKSTSPLTELQVDSKIPVKGWDLDQWSQWIDQHCDECFSPFNVRILNVAQADLVTFMEALKSKERITVLDLSSSQLTQIPETIGAITSILVLHLCENMLTRLPDGISRLINLRELDLQHNAFTTIPTGIFSLPGLQILVLDHNQIEVISPEIVSLQSLKTLSIKNNAISSLPRSLYGLQGLEYLFLSGNDITVVEDGIEQLTSLLKIDLSQNSNLSVFPFGLSRIPSLSEIDITQTRICELPTFVGHLQQLHWSSSEAILLASSFSLPTLSVLHLSGQIHRIPEHFRDFTGLIELNLSHNIMEEFPEAILKLIDLKALYLGHNSIAIIPSNIAVLANLKTLDVSHNPLEALPESISGMSKVVFLNLQETRVLSTLPKDLFHLRNVRGDGLFIPAPFSLDIKLPHFQPYGVGKPQYSGGSDSQSCDCGDS